MNYEVIAHNLVNDRLAVVARLLTEIKIQPYAAFTRQWSTANINHQVAMFLIDGLVLNGYVEAYPYRSRTRYRITVKGRDFLNQIIDCYMLLDEVEGCVSRFVEAKEVKFVENVIE